jgi:hypothetical protein
MLPSIALSSQLLKKEVTAVLLLRISLYGLNSGKCYCRSFFLFSLRAKAEPSEFKKSCMA